MQTLPFGADLILQDLLHYRLILEIERLEIKLIDTDDYMLDHVNILARLFGVVDKKPDAWVNTYMMYLERAKDYQQQDLHLLALECYEAMSLLANGIIHQSRQVLTP